MRAITVSRFGGPEVLQEAEVPDPTPGVGEVVIDIAATAINRADVLQRQGHYPPPSGASEIVGLECSGRISAVGGEVDEWHVGDEVCALLSGGGYAAKVAVPAGQLLPIPSGVSLEEAAALPELTATVWLNLFQTARLMPGETVLIHGGSGGVGTMALQLARFFGATVFCTASPAKAAKCQALGAHRVIDYHTEDFVSVLHEESPGADVVLDSIGAKYLRKNIDALAKYGRLVVIGLQGGRIGEIDLGKVLSKQIVLAGTVLRSRTVSEKADIIADVKTHIWPLIEQGAVKPIIDRVFALADVIKAHTYFEKGDHFGKVLLVS